MKNPIVKLTSEWLDKLETENKPNMRWEVEKPVIINLYKYAKHKVMPVIIFKDVKWDLIR